MTLTTTTDSRWTDHWAQLDAVDRRTYMAEARRQTEADVMATAQEARLEYLEFAVELAWYDSDAGRAETAARREERAAADADYQSADIQCSMCETSGARSDMYEAWDGSEYIVYCPVCAFRTD